MSDKNEVERLRRLREQQINARDPRHAERKHAKIVSGRPRAAPTLRDELRKLPAKVTWLFWGALWGIGMGLFFATVLFLAFQVRWYVPITLGTMAFSAMLGSLFGASKDSGKEDWPR